MNSDPKGRPGAREFAAPDPAQKAEPKPGRTPRSELQPDDAGTAASGQPDGGNTAEAAMKQTSKTPSESGSRR